ncbi:MAG: class I SAM-dependent methyltransferase [Betaproteobacteria bacterium]|nr:class I SAM-dependent methyltransferase [Betaproteobacteria bacterium]
MRYGLQKHIPRILNGYRWAGKRVLEIGTGVGTDARFIIERGGIYTGVNVDAGSTAATAEALRLHNLPGRVVQCDATDLQFDDESFDVVYSFGVLHHIPEVEKVMSEIRRVLIPGGDIIAMLYNRDSINYAIEIKLLRRLGVQVLRIPGTVELFARAGFPADKLARHRELAGRAYKMSDEEWLSRNTDGPDNPFSRVYDAKEAAKLFSGFEVWKQDVYFFNHEHWGPLGRATPRSLIDALGKHWGWHRLVYASTPLRTTRRRV